MRIIYYLFTVFLVVYNHRKGETIKGSDDNNGTCQLATLGCLDGQIVYLTICIGPFNNHNVEDSLRKRCSVEKQQLFCSLAFYGILRI